MADGTLAPIPAAAPIPVEQILRTRQDFPGCRLTYEVQLDSGGWPGLAALAAACAAAGLRLVTLKALGNGTIFCALGDDGTADLAALGRALGPALTIAGWTTIVLYPEGR
ncbi:MAG: hypothetical protein JSR87_10235 [Proteobacteria bacterium]|nr:hypothetical protein [Pseudomonadota bacterium]MBS0571641.1 hypothetical protein [Pseudomonadota bacterium]